MTPMTEQLRVPLALDASGVYRVGGTRVSLESLLAGFEQGATPEDLADQYPSVSLADIYAVVAYYLTHREEVTTYLKHVDTLEAEALRQIESDFGSSEIRRRWRARAGL